MSSPRDRDGSDDGGEWQEPAHLSGDEPDQPNFADRRKQPRDTDAGRDSWQPPGWDLPAADPHRDRPAGVDPAWSPPATPSQEEQAPEEPARRGLFGGPHRGADPELERAFLPETDPVGAQGWALQHGWTVSDGSGPEDAALAELVMSAPVRPGKEARAASVLRGRYGSLELVAFDIAYPLGQGLVPKYAVTAAPLLGAVPGLRLSPARLWKHRTAGLLPIASGNEAFDTRWMLLAAEDGPQVRRLSQDPAVHGLLLGSDDGDEFWTAGGFLAAVRPDGHRPQLLEHHARLLTAIGGALAAGV